MKLISNCFFPFKDVRHQQEKIFLKAKIWGGKCLPFFSPSPEVLSVSNSLLRFHLKLFFSENNLTELAELLW